jgi:hypothetical protein
MEFAALAALKHLAAESFGATLDNVAQGTTVAW